MQCTTLLILPAWPLVPPWLCGVAQLWIRMSTKWHGCQSLRHCLRSPPPAGLAGPWVPRVPKSSRTSSSAAVASCAPLGGLAVVGPTKLIANCAWQVTQVSIQPASLLFVQSVPTDLLSIAPAASVLLLSPSHSLLPSKRGLGAGRSVFCLHDGGISPIHPFFTSLSSENLE